MDIFRACFVLLGLASQALSEPSDDCFQPNSTQTEFLPDLVCFGLLNSTFETNIVKDIELYFYKPGSNQEGRLEINCTGCLDTFNRKGPLIIIAHGFRDNHKSFRSLVRAFQSMNSTYNIINVNWEKLASGSVVVDYPWKAKNIIPVGEHIGHMIDWLMRVDMVNLEDIHFIGHSLGAQVGNFVAETIKKLNKTGKIGRITGLDPASPCFKDKPNEKRLDSSDAIFVDVIHTSTFYLGFEQPCGSADFYPNSGNGQPGCTVVNATCLKACSHSRAIEFFEESIANPGGFVSCRVESLRDLTQCIEPKETTEMGFWASWSGDNATFYLHTNAGPPYGMGELGGNSGAETIGVGFNSEPVLLIMLLACAYGNIL